MFFVGAFIIILLLLTGIFFISLLVISIRGFRRGDKNVGYFFLVILLVFILLPTYFLFTKKGNKTNPYRSGSKRYIKKRKDYFRR